MMADWRQKQTQAHSIFQQKQYAQAAQLYEEAISLEPTVTSNYWYLGLALLLQGDETAAQIAWMTPILEVSEKQQEKNTVELLHVLHSEAQNQELQESWELAWLIRQHIKEISPNDINNLLNLLKLSIKTGFTLQENLLERTKECLQISGSEINIHLLQETLQQVLERATPQDKIIQFAEACTQKVPYSEELANILLERAKKWYNNGYGTSSANLMKICMQISPDRPEVLSHAISFLQDNGRCLETIPIVETLLNKVTRIGDRLGALHLKIRAFLYTGGKWEEGVDIYHQHQELLQEIITKKAELSVDELRPVLTAGVFSAYFEDAPEKQRRIRNQYAAVCQEKLQEAHSDKVERHKNYHTLLKTTSSNSKKLKIGYLSGAFRKNSIGWLIRWPLLHHDRDHFEIHAYSTINKSNDPVQNVISTVCQPHFHKMTQDVTTKIIEDEIDILVDLDSLTSNFTCAVMALKPAPIQMTWLGFDASGFPAIDYFLADPYVLPESASQYYQETIWRLPKTYIAVDGFEIGVPTLRRDRLGIPNDAIVYFSSQSGAKRNPDNIRTQMRILKEVPNSYFLIKGLLTDLESVKELFQQIAESEGVSCDRLCFLPNVPLESTHRGNLQIADVVLDTYPYNGATTTLETLWMEIPLVTQVGTQFAARNSYTMLLNAGVREGIAWNEQEYIEWGVRLGKDAKLRQKVAWQLRLAKQQEPLWNTEQFVRDLEQAYEQMWQKFVDGV